MSACGHEQCALSSAKSTSAYQQLCNAIFYSFNSKIYFSYTQHVHSVLYFLFVARGQMSLESSLMSVIQKGVESTTVASPVDSG